MTKTNEEKLQKIYDETYLDISRYVISKCNNLYEVEDILQNIYFNFYKIMTRKEINNPRKYLFRVARNEIFKNYGISNLAKNTIPLFSVDFFSDEKILIEKDHIENKLLYDDIFSYLKKGDQLTFKIFELYFHYDLKIKEISGLLKISESTVKNKLYRTMKKLKKIFILQEE